MKKEILTKITAVPLDLFPLISLPVPASGFSLTLIFVIMHLHDDLQLRWWKLEEKMIQRFGKKPDLEALLFLIGIQEVGQIREKFTKEQKQDLMHVAVCKLLSQSGYYELEKTDDEGWPHFRQLKPMPEMTAPEQENFLKDHILLYFESHTI